ncbi:unnamed protein product [Rhizophagus irregularis]|nr:unnamed protein product [Rhizophagus irregularis]
MFVRYILQSEEAGEPFEDDDEVLALIEYKESLRSFSRQECYNQLANAVIQESQNQGLVFTVNPGKCNNNVHIRRVCVPTSYIN